MQRVQAEADAEVADAQKFAEESPEPLAKDAFNAIYATTHSKSSRQKGG